MKLFKIVTKKNRAQAMVEFAIVLPLLLLLLYGLLEAGRLLFMYSTIVTASRQAVRYGSATGDGSTPGVARYNDCAGIRLAAQKVDFLNAFDDADIAIFHDNGPNSTATAYCGGNPVTSLPVSDTYQPSGNSERLLVKIQGDFNPIVPKIVPFIARTVANNNPIRATSARTILTGVAIAVTAPAGTGAPGPTSGLGLSITPSQTTYSAAGEIIYFTYTLTNNSNPPVDITGPFTITDSFGSITCPDNPLAAGATAACPQVAYVVTQADVDAQRTITDTATANNGIIVSNQATSSVTFAAQPALTLAKSASPQASATVGQVITYTYTLTNSGNVALDAPYTVSDDKIPSQSITCPTSGVLPVGLSTTCTGTYTLRQQDINAKTLVNHATATARFGTQTVTSNQATVTVFTPALYLTASVSPSTVSQVGQVITYTYTLQNLSANALTGPYPISGGRGTNNCGTNNGGLAPSASFSCTGTYTVTQADLDAGVSLTNTVSASAIEGNGNKTTTSNDASVSVSVTSTPGLTMQIASVSPNPATTLNTVITYIYTLTNTGNVTLSTLQITDNVVKNATCPATLAPGAAVNCTGTYTVTQTDLNAGSITNQATGSATYKSQPVSSLSQAFTVVTYQGPRLKLQITVNPTTFTGVGQFIVYSYTLTNTGSVPLYGPYFISDNKVTFIDCSTATSPLAAAASTTCVGSYATTQADLDNNFIDSVAVTSASDGTQTINSNTATATVTRQGAATRTPTPTVGPSPTPTNTPTPTRTPTPTATSVPVCNNITVSTITTPTNTMTMTITNPNPYAVTVSNVVVKWNRTGGAGNSILSLQRASLGGTQFWNGPSNNTGGPLTITPSTTLTIPGNNATTTITFTFDNNYQTLGGESIVINLSTPGCGSTPIHQP